MQRAMRTVRILAVLGLIWGSGFLSMGGAQAVPLDSQPSSKATAQVGHMTFLTAQGSWATLLSNTLKTANKKDLFVNVSLVSMLYTETTAKSKMGTTDTETAEAGVEVRVLLDGNPVSPGTVTFAKRKQTLSAKFQGIITDALVMGPDGTLIIDPALVTEEEVTLILETMSADAFFFVAGDVAAGTHRLEVQARIDSAVSSSDAQARALVGPGSFTVESVRLIKNEDILLD